MLTAWDATACAISVLVGDMGNMERELNVSPLPAASSTGCVVFFFLTFLPLLSLSCTVEVARFARCPPAKLPSSSSSCFVATFGSGPNWFEDHASGTAGGNCATLNLNRENFG